MFKVNGLAVPKEQESNLRTLSACAKDPTTVRSKGVGINQKDFRKKKVYAPADEMVKWKMKNFAKQKKDTAQHVVGRGVSCENQYPSTSLRK